MSTLANVLIILALFVAASGCLNSTEDSGASSRAYFNPLGYRHCHKGKFGRFDWMNARGSKSFICKGGEPSRASDEDEEDQQEYLGRNLSSSNSSRRVIGGFGTVRLGEFPSYVSVIFELPKEQMSICGGTLLNSHLVLTAAHCINTKARRGVVIAGRQDLRDQTGQMNRIRRACLPKEFPEGELTPEVLKRLTHDWAIIELDQPFKFNGATQPGCVNLDFDLKPNARCVIVGFGQTSQDSAENNSKVRGAVVEGCPSDENDPPNLLCMRAVGRPKDGAGQACKGDSGGALYCYENCSGTRPRMYSVGIVSGTDSSNGCSLDNQLILTKTLAHREGIKRLIRRMSRSRRRFASTSGFRCINYMR